jgi:thiol-disulfide isomerase/thioredoxin
MTIFFLGLQYWLSLLLSPDTTKIPAILSKNFDYRVCTVVFMPKSTNTVDSLVQAFNGRILFKDIFLDRKSYTNGCSQFKFSVFIGCKNDSIYIGLDRNHNKVFEKSEIQKMQANHKTVLSYDIYPSKICNDYQFADSTVLHLIPFVNQLRYSDISATDTMLQISYSKGYVRKYKINDTLEIESSALSIARIDSTATNRFIGYSPSGAFVLYPDRDFLTLNNGYYSITENTTKDTLKLILSKNSTSKTKIQIISASLLNGLKPYELGEEKNGNIIFKKKYILLDFWATYCAPCISAMPHLNELNQRFNSKVQIIGICIDANDKKKNAKRLIGNNLGYEQYFISPKAGINIDQILSEKAGVIVYPTYILLDDSGNVLNLANDISTMDSTLKNIVDGIKFL